MLRRYLFGCITFFAVFVIFTSVLSGEERPEWQFPEGNFAPLFPFKVEKGAPDNITNIQTWGNPWTDAAGGEILSTRDARFYKGDTPFHFMGTNLCFGANFCEHADAERLAETLSRFGIRVVRLHHMDSQNIWGKNYDRTKTEIDPEQLEKLDYLIAQFHKRGIYVNINLHVSRAFDERDGFENSDTLPLQSKGVDQFEPRMIELQKKYARDLLTHVNPYTGHAYTDDPGAAMIEINNENSVVASWYWGALDTLGPTYTACLQKKWNDWLLKKYGSTEKCLAAYPLEEGNLSDDQLNGKSIPESLEPNIASDGWTVQADNISSQKIDISTDETGKRTLKLAVEKMGGQPWFPQIYRSGLTVEEGKLYTLTFTIKASRPTKVMVNVTQNHAPWGNAGFWRSIPIGGNRRTMTICFRATKTDDNARFSFSQLEPGVTLELSDVSFQNGGDISYKPDERIEKGTLPILRRNETARMTCEPLRRDFIQFLVDLETSYWGGMYHFIKDELQAKPPVTGTQYQYGSWYAQEQTDYGDNHSYWQHPQFPNRSWDANDWFIRTEAMVNSDSGGTLSRLSINRVIGKAYTVSEYDHPYPNLYGAEGNLMAAAVAAFQGWSGLYQFAWSHSPNFDPNKGTSFFDMCGNQAKMVHLPACYAILGRGDVKSGPGKFVSVQDISHSAELNLMTEIEGGWNPISNRLISDELLGMVCWGGVNLTDAPSAVTLSADKTNVTDWDQLPEEMGRPQNGEIRNEFGQLCWNTQEEGAGYFTVDTPGVKVFTGFVRDRSFDFSGLTLTPGKTRLDWTTVSITAANPAENTGENADSDQLNPGRYLIAATGLVQNTDAKFIAYEKDKMTTGSGYGGSNGHEPVLCEGIPLTVTLHQTDAAKTAVFALDASGNQKEAVPVTAENGSVQFQLGPQYQTLWYELDIAE